MLKKRTMFLLQQKKISSQEMQISTKSNTEINENMSKNNYNNRNMQKRVISENDMLATSLTTRKINENTNTDNYDRTNM